MKFFPTVRSFGFRQTMLLTAGCFVLIACGVTGITLVSRSYSRQGTRQTETLTGQFLPGLVTLARLQEAAHDLRTITYQFALAKNEAAMSEKKREFQKTTVLVARGLAELTSLAHDRSTQSLIAAFAPEVEKYRENAERFENELGAGDFDKAMATLDHDVEPAQGQIETELQSLSERYFQLSRDAGARTTALLAQSDHFGLLSTTVLAGFTLLCLGLTLAAARALVAQMEKRDAERQAAQDTLEKRVEERTAELASSLSILDATLNSTADGILAVNLSRQVVCHNTKFSVLWGIPAEVMEKRDGAKLAEFTAGQVKNPEQFLQRIAELHQNVGTEAFDVIELKDGRTIERYIQPQLAAGASVGMVLNFRDITARKRAEAEFEKVHKQLLDTSRQAGMAEVATSVLHNVGNVLNSVNVASNCVANGLRKSKAASLARVVAMLREHQENLGAFFTGDARAKNLPAFLGQLDQQLTAERTSALEELAHLQKNIEHIKDIVAMQQTYARVSGVKETVQITDLIEDTLRMNVESFANHHVHVERDYAEVPPVTVEKHKVLQILVNLVRNAKHACDDGGRTDKTMTLRVFNGDGKVKVAVVDNGIGISPENLTRIFNHGFTTKKDGHGFGLHSGALAASELGGSLRVESRGVGLGATFTLELPVGPTEAKG